MLKRVRKGPVVRFSQIYDKEKKPKIRCYSLKGFIEVPDKNESEVGYGTLSITADNIVKMQPGEINLEHFNKYKESRKNNLLKLILN